MEEFWPKPLATDVGKDDLGSYSRKEIMRARKSLLGYISDERKSHMRNIRYKLGILPDGRRYRLPSDEMERVWIPKDVPMMWSAPVFLQNQIPGSSSLPHTEAGSTNRAGSSSDFDPLFNYYDEEGHFQSNYRGEERNSQYSYRDEERNFQYVYSDEEENSRNIKNGEYTAESNTKWESTRKRPVEETTGSEREMAKPSSYWEYGRQRPDEERWPGQEMAKPSSYWEYGRERPDEERWPGQDLARKRPRLETGSQLWQTGAMYEVMYTCDLCDFMSLVEESMNAHLKNQEHYSASRCLGLINNGKLQPKFVWRASMLLDKEQMWKHKVPICPHCDRMFDTVGDCAAHATHKHGMQGAYTLRDVVKPYNGFPFAQDWEGCLDCKRRCPTKEKLRQHMAAKNHRRSDMDGNGKENMLVLPCMFCPNVLYNSSKFIEHVLRNHEDRLPLHRYYRGGYMELGPATPTLILPPPDPGVPLDLINFDFSQDAPDKSLEMALEEEKERLQCIPLIANRYPNHFSLYLELRRRTVILSRGGREVDEILSPFRHKQKVARCNALRDKQWRKEKKEKKMIRRAKLRKREKRRKEEEMQKERAPAKEVGKFKERQGFGGEPSGPPFQNKPKRRQQRDAEREIMQELEKYKQRHGVFHGESSGLPPPPHLHPYCHPPRRRQGGGDGVLNGGDGVFNGESNNSPSRRPRRHPLRKKKRKRANLDPPPNKKQRHGVPPPPSPHNKKQKQGNAGKAVKNKGGNNSKKNKNKKGDQPGKSGNKNKSGNQWI